MKRTPPLLRILALLLLLLLTFTACGGADEPAESQSEPGSTTAEPSESSNPSEEESSSEEEPSETEPETILDVEGTTLNIVKNGLSNFSIVYYGADSTNILNSVRNLQARIKTRTGKSLSRVKDATDPNENAPEILVGNTKRPETKQVKDSLPENSYAVRKVDNCLVIVGTDAELTVLALYAFQSAILNNEQKCAKGYLFFDESDNILVTRDKPLTLAEKLKHGYTLFIDSQKVVQTAKQGQYSIGQGACSDGTYVYFALRNKNDTGSVITKHRLSNGEFIAVSGVLDLGHANDMTFDTKNNRIVVAHGQSEGRILTMVNPEDLTFIEDITIPKGSGAITYSVAGNRYAISQGGTSLHILTDTFGHVVSYTRVKNENYTAQGMGSDEDLIFFPMSGKSDNILATYDWNGNYITDIHIPLDIESESMFWVNGKYYVAYNTNGEALYETTFDIVFA